VFQDAQGVRFREEWVQMEEALKYVVTTFVAASSIAATTVLKEATKDMYTKLHDRLAKKISPTDVKALKDNPKDDSQQQIVMLRLGQEFKVDEDEAGFKTLFALAEELSQAIKTHHTETYKEFALDVQRNEVQGDFIVKDNKGNLSIKDNKVGGKVDISGNEGEKKSQ
jgi:hypothetical protein